MNNITSNITVPDGWIISHEDTKKIETLIPYQYINMGIGGSGVFINCVLLTVLLSSKYFLKNGRLTILLCMGDLANCLYIFLQGYQRSRIYIIILKYQIIQPQTYWTCALMPFDWMGILGSLLPHMVTFIMGLERIIALKFPVLYKRYFSDNQIKPTLFCLGYVFISMIVAFTLAYIHRNVPTKYYCGRKASYTSIYTSFIYVMNIAGYSVCFLLTFIVMLHIKLTSKETLEKKKGMKKDSKKALNDVEKRILKNYQRIKTIVFISFISSITIAFPNFISLGSTIFGSLDASLADTSDWISVLKSSINFFVYTFMNNEFKAHLFGKILKIKRFRNEGQQVGCTKVVEIKMKKRMTIG